MQRGGVEVAADVVRSLLSLGFKLESLSDAAFHRNIFACGKRLLSGRSAFRPEGPFV